MAPLTRSRADKDGVQSSLAVEYYKQRASAGLIITEATNISRQGRGYAFTPGIYTDTHVEAWRHVTDAVHQAGGKIVCQLWHVGRMSHVDLQENGAAPVAPSAIRAGELIFLETRTQAPPSMPRALKIDEIPELVKDYKNAARKAKDAGFDGVEVHSANNYLLEQFVRDSTNKRTDKYGVQSRIGSVSLSKWWPRLPMSGGPITSASVCRPSRSAILYKVVDVIVGLRPSVEQDDRRWR